MLLSMSVLLTCDWSEIKIFFVLAYTHGLVLLHMLHNLHGIVLYGGAEYTVLQHIWWGRVSNMVGRVSKTIEFDISNHYHPALPPKRDWPLTRISLLLTK